MHDIQLLTFADVGRLGERLRTAGLTQQSMEQVAQNITQIIYNSFLNYQTQERSFVLVRLFKTHALDRLPVDLRHRVVGEEKQEIANPHCLTLLGSSGDETHWNSRHASRGHQAIPLYSQEFVLSLPMVSNLLIQLGFKISEVVNPEQAVQVEADSNQFNVFFVEDARGSALIPAQDEFVIPYGIQSVIGFGGVLPDRTVFAVIVFSRHAIDRMTAMLFRPLARNVLAALLPFVSRVFDEDVVVVSELDADARDRELHILRAQVQVLQDILQVTVETSHQYENELSLINTRLQATNDEFSTQQKSFRLMEERLRGIVDTVLDGIVTIDAQGRILMFNPAAERLFGYRLEEVVGRNVKMLMPEPYCSEHDGYLARYLREGHPRVIGKGREVQGRRKEGSVFPMHLSVGAMEHEGKRMFVGVIADITERKAAEAELRQHRDHLEQLVAIATAEVTAIVQTAVNAVITIDGKGIVQTFNPSAEKLFGWTRQEVVGQNVSMLMEPRIAALHDSYLERFLTTREARIIGLGREVTAMRKDGTTFPAYLAVGHTEIAKDRPIFVGYLSDITPQKQNESELKQAKEDAEAGARTKAAFMANMSHEIRTPMNAVIGFSEVVLQDATLRPETRNHVRTILGSARSLLNIINDVLDVSKLESGKMSMESVCFHLPNALADTLRTVEHRASEKNLDVRLICDLHLPLRVMGDPVRLRQVILNLVGNAIKFTERGGVTLSVRPGEEAGMIHFSVADTGLGMTQEQVDRVFEAFSQADISTTRRFGGTGLGTTISKQIVELMGGEIRVESEVGHGSIFHFTARLPVAEQMEGCLYEEDDSMDEMVVSPRLFRILLAEDIEANASLAMLRLTQQGHEVVWVKNGQEAVDCYSHGVYDLILMDVMMPVLDGLGATQAIRALEEGVERPISIVALTASVMHEERASCLAAGMDAVEAKPIDFNHLFSVMEHIVPVGVGRPNTVCVQETGTRSVVDFSPLDGLVNYRKALKTWGDQGAYLKALISFVETRLQDAQQMRFELDAHPDQSEPARAVAHALKGVAGNLAMEPVASLAAEMESELKAGQREQMEVKLAALDGLLEKIGYAMAGLKNPVEDGVQPLPSLDIDGVRPVLMELLDAVDSLNPDPVVPILEKLAQYVVPADLVSIRKSVDRFDFDGAREHILSLQKQLGLS